MISITNQTVSTNAAAGAVVGKLTLLDANRVGLSANFILTKGAAGFFGISGTNLVTVNASIPPGFYSVPVSAVGTRAWSGDKAFFTITVTAT
jgi:hypothetical protein